MRTPSSASSESERVPRYIACDSFCVTAARRPRPDLDRAASAARIRSSSSTSKETTSPPVPPENQGLARPVTPGTQVLVELHSINTDDEPQLREVWISVEFADASTVTTAAAPLALIPSPRDIPPGTRIVLQSACAGPTAETRIVELTGRLPVNGTRVSARRRAPNGARELVYEGYRWSAPARLRFDSITSNPLPDPTTQRTGGHTGILTFRPGDILEWECEITNGSDFTIRLTDPSKDLCALYGSVTSQPWRCVGDTPL